MDKKFETKMCLVDEAENIVFPLKPYRYGYIIPEEFSGSQFILCEDDIYMVKPVEFEVDGEEK